MINVTYFSENIFMNISMAVSFFLFLFLFFVFVISVISVLKKEKRFEAKELPKASILIPAYNEQDNIEKCLTSLVSSNYDGKKIEVLVIDDGSTDDTKAIVEKFAAKSNRYPIRIISGKHEGKSAALNLGITHANNEIVISIDADCILDKQALRHMVAPFSEDNVAATNSVVLIEKPGNLLENFQSIEFALNNIIRLAFSKIFKNSIWFFGVAAAYRKSALKKIGGFKKDCLTEDMDVCLELNKAGYRIITVKDAIIKTPACRSIRSLFSQRMRWYFGALQALSKNKSVLKNKTFSAPVLFLYVNQFWWTFFSFVFFPMTAYQVYYWLPQTFTEIFWYIFRWFSIFGPIFVLYKLPEWGLNFINIFGVLSGIITLVMSIYAVLRFNKKFGIMTLIGIIFYFPYTILINLALVLGVLRYSFRKKRYFIN